MSAQLTRLSAWLEGAGITWDEALIQMRPAGGGLGVFAVADVPEGATLCEIPRRAVLSVRTSGAADLLEAHGIREGLGLAIAIMYELSLGARSPWCAPLPSTSPHASRRRGMQRSWALHRCT